MSIPRLAAKSWVLLILLLNAVFAANLKSELLGELGRAQAEENLLFEQDSFLAKTQQ